MGWRSIRDRELLSLAQPEFEVLVTIDAGFMREQNLAKVSLGIVLVRVPNNKLSSYVPLFEAMRSAAENVGPGKLVIVGGDALGLP